MAKSRKDAVPDFSTLLMDKELERTGQSDPLAFIGIDPVVGVPLEALSLQFLFGMTVSPIGKMYELVGPPECMKSCFSHEIGRWHIYGRTNYVAYDPAVHIGKYIYHLAESNRDQPGLRQSVIRTPLDASPPPILSFTKHKVVEDWQAASMNVVNIFDGLTYANGKAMAVGDTPFIVCNAIDSLTGMRTRREYDKTREDGFATTGFAQVAGSVDMWLKVFASAYEGWPLTLVCTNHYKPKKDAQGKVIDHHVPGGFQPAFADSLRFRLDRADYNQGFIDLGRTRGREIVFTTMKNSFTAAAGRRKLVVQVTWDETVEPQQTTWQWHDATINLLAGPGLDDKSKRKVAKVLDLEIDKTNRRVTSSTLGVKRVSWDEGGRAVMQNPEIVKALQEVFLVRAGTPMLPGKTYLMCLTEERQKIFENAKTNPVVYTNQSTNEEE